MSSVLSTRLPDTPSSRWLAGSLALNLFLVSIAGAVAARHYLMPQQTARAPAVDRSISARIDRLAATLPQADAEIMRNMYRTQAPAIEPRQDTYRRAQDKVRQALRTQPFEIDSMRSAMTEARGARLAFDQSVQDFMASAAGAMSPAGRGKLADWPPNQRTASNNTSR